MGARSLLEKLRTLTPNVVSIQHEIALLSSEINNFPQAVVGTPSFDVDVRRPHPSSWRGLGDLLCKDHKIKDARNAYAKHFEASAAKLKILESAARGPHDQLPAAENMLCEWLLVDASDISVRQMLGSVYIRLGRYDDAEKQLVEVLDLAPTFSAARWMLAGTFYHRGQWEKVLTEVERLLQEVPEKSEYLDLKGFALLNLGKFQTAIECYDQLVQKDPAARNWRALGYALRVVGRQNDSIAAYRKAIALNPGFGQAYWGLANFKTFRFSLAEIETMFAMLERVDLDPDSRSQMHFALGKALEDEKRYASAFEQYRKANTILRARANHQPLAMREFVRSAKAVLTAEFWRERSGWGHPASDPIFVVGLPRSGTTLIEQILASHSMVEGAGELTALESAARRLAARSGSANSRYPELLRSAEPQDIRSAGQDYIETTRSYRKLNRPFVVDKMPNNFVHIGLLHLCLPNARIIDARRHPLGSGFAIYKHHFQHGNSFAFDLEDIGNYYRHYVELMAHFDAVLPGVVHRVIYEQMVTNPEHEIRRLLAYCGLQFEDACLRFHETKRGVLTPSSEQVRQPMFAGSVELWRHYEPWLDGLKSVLGDVLTCWPGVPTFNETQPTEAASWANHQQWSVRIREISRRE